MRRGEIFFVALIALIGATWILMSTKLPYMDDGVPAAGYFPFWIGLLVVFLSALLVLTTRGGPAEDVEEEEPGNWHRPAMVAGGLIVCVALLELVGFGAAVAAYLLFLLLVVEKLPWRTAGGAAIGISAVIIVVFHTLLAVPLPTGPWGF